MSNIKPSLDQQINVKIRDRDGTEVHFKAKRSTKIGKLKKAFSERVERSVSKITLRFDGERLDDDNATLQALEIEDGNVIEVFSDQLGGAARTRARGYATQTGQARNGAQRR